MSEIAPKNMTGIYMGIGQFPWFLTKIVTSLYSGWFLMNYCPADKPRGNDEHRIYVADLRIYSCTEPNCVDLSKTLDDERI